MGDSVRALWEPRSVVRSTSFPSTPVHGEKLRPINEQPAVDIILVMGLIDWMPNQTLIYEGSGRECPVSDAGRCRVLRVAARLFEEGLMMPGELSADGFHDWQGAPEAWLVRAKCEFERFQWHSMGDGFWLRLTGPGTRLAESTTGVSQADGGTASGSGGDCGARRGASPAVGCAEIQPGPPARPTIGGRGGGGAN